MRIALFDGIVETHVASSLERSLLAAGHHVFNTGKLGHGYAFAKEESNLRAIENALNLVLDYRPDVIFVFRPGSLPAPLLKRAKASGAILVAWFSDDPVLWNLSYGPVVDSYDIVLHCGTARVLDFYEKMHGRPTGVNFPFWTDEQSFPYVYGKRQRSSDAVFLGNVHDEVRRQRYFDLGSLNSSLKVYGNVGRDYFGIWGGYLDSDADVVEAGAHAGVAINIPQYFKDHRGLDTWFDGLDRLGFFQYPSRVIQYAAMGLPIISVVPDAQDLSTFPEIRCVSGMAQLDAAIADVVNSGDAMALSKATHERFLRNYSAKARVMALENLLVDESWRDLDAVGRSQWFSQFDGLAPSDKSAELTGRDRESINLVPGVKVDAAPRRILLAGNGFDRVTSVAAVTDRALTNLGHLVSRVVVEDRPDLFPEAPMTGHKYSLKAQELLDGCKEGLDVIVFAGVDCDLSTASVKTLRERGINVAYIGCPASKDDAWLDALSQKVDYLGLLNPDVAGRMRNKGHLNCEHLPYLVDDAFQVALTSAPTRSSGITLVGHRRMHFAGQAPAFKDIAGIPTKDLFIEERDPAFKNLDMLADSLKCSLIIAPYDASVAGPLPSEVLPFALASGSLTVVPRGVGPMNLGSPGEESTMVRERGELALKLSDLSKSEDRVGDILMAAKKLVEEDLNAETRLRILMSNLVSQCHEIPDDLKSEHAVAHAEEIPFDSQKSSYVASLLRANVHGSIAAFTVAPNGKLVRGESVSIDVLLDNSLVYREVFVGGQRESSLRLEIPSEIEEFTLQVRQTYLGQSWSNNSLGKAFMRVSVPTINKPSHKISMQRIYTNSAWGFVY